jgi:hypothetical protein
MGSIDNHHNYGIVRNIENDIVGFNLSPDLFVGFTHEDIFKALERYAKEKAVKSSFRIETITVFPADKEDAE